MYTLPYFTESDSSESTAIYSSGEPFFSLKTMSYPGSLWAHIYSQRPPVVVVDASERLLDQGFIAQLSAAVAVDKTYIVAVVTTTSDKLMAESLNQGADRVVSAPQCSNRIFRALIKSLLPKTQSASCYAPYRLNAYNRTVFIGDRHINVRRLVFELANYLFTHNGSIVPKAALLRDLWGLDNRCCETRRVESCASLVKKHLQLDGTYGWRLRSTRGTRAGYGVFRRKVNRRMHSDFATTASYTSGSSVVTIDRGFRHNRHEPVQPQ